MNDAIVDAGTIEGYCGLKTLVQDAAEIQLPAFLTDNIADAQARALSVDRNGTGQEGWVYRVVVDGAKTRRVSRTTSILYGGTIRILEAIHVRRGESGQLERLERTSY